VTVSPIERVIDAVCGAEDVTIRTLSPAGARWLELAKTGRGTPVWPGDPIDVSMAVCPWEGQVTEHIYTHAGIAEWTCPLCWNVHQRDIR
jgi:hypothetical protein